ncbi:hypothetical protein SDC9_154646 [bioreactor metagenome]|uniref:Uncharacterized protein n=1 Tax=bioreactor metagenome TaxID=1076179 RepID=A0A645EZL3_9ZZZZ
MIRIRISAQIFVHFTQRVTPVQVIAVDGAKGSVNCVTAGKNGMACTPGLHASFRYPEPIREVIQFLHHILNFHAAFNMLADYCTEILINPLVYNENHPLKPNLQRIIQ